MITAPRQAGRLSSCSLIALLACFGWTADVSAQAPSRSLTCSLQRTGTDFKGVCEVPCEVNALAVNFDGVKPNFSCYTPPRRVAASLRETEKTGWIGTMEGAQPEDPTRLVCPAKRADGREWPLPKHRRRQAAAADCRRHQDIGAGPGAALR